MNQYLADGLNFAGALGGLIGLCYTAYQIGKSKICYVKISDCKELHDKIQIEVKKEVNEIIEKILAESLKRESEDVKLHEKVDSANIKIAMIEGKISKRSAQ